MSAIPEMTPSKMFFAARSVPPGNVWTFTFPRVRIETSFAQCSIWTQGKVAAGGKFAYRSVIGSAARTVPVAAGNDRNSVNRKTGKTGFIFNEHLPEECFRKPSASSGGKKCSHLNRIPPARAIRFFPPRVAETAFPAVQRTETRIRIDRRRKD